MTSLSTPSSRRGSEKSANGLHFQDELANFEKGRIKELQEERLQIQKKTFTKWMNSFLAKARMEVEDLFRDLADGKKLLKLLEIISGEKLGKPNNGKMRVHHVENVNKSLAFLHTKVRLESIGAEDVVDGNPRLILGLIWTIILRFQIQEIEIDVDEDNAQSTEKKSAKDALLLWCQRRTHGYNNVNIQDFSGSWRSGLGFNALIHAHRPDLIRFDNLVVSKAMDNLNNAFDVAERELGIPRLLDAEDIDCPKPDEKSVLTYVASYYHTFARMKNELKGGRRIANIVGQIIQADTLKQNYESLTSTLLTWINATIIKFETKKLPNKLDEIKSELIQFKTYRTVEKPPKYREKSELEANYFGINIRLKELNQSGYTPPDGKLIHDIERAWVGLEKAEYGLESRLKGELLRQETLEQMASRFWKKTTLRHAYLKDMIQVLSDKRYGANIGLVEATLKKHEAISADIMAREGRCKQLKQMSDYLKDENFHQKEEVGKKCDQILDTWDELLKLLNKHKENLSRFNEINQLEKEIESVEEEIAKFRQNFDKTSSHLIECEDLLQKLNLNEVQIGNLGEVVKKIVKLSTNHADPKLEKLANQMKQKYDSLLSHVNNYRTKLEEELAYFKLIQDLDEEEDWLEEKKRLVVLKAKFNVKDLRSVVRQQQKLRSLQEEVRARSELQGRLFDQASELNIETLPLRLKIEELKKEITLKESKLKSLEKTFQFYQDCNEIKDWIEEKRPLVESKDYGQDVATASALLQRHKDLLTEIDSFRSDVESLKTIDLRTIIEEEENESDEDYYVQEQRLVPQEYVEEEEIERTEYKTVTEERAVAQVKALYAFKQGGGDGGGSGENVEMVKGEVMFLLSKTNSDWWNIRKANGQDGFVPANYVKEIEPKVVLVQVRKPEVIKEVKKVKKTKMVMTTFEKKVKKVKSGDKNKENLESQVGQVLRGYGEIVECGKSRHLTLLTSIRLFTFFSECDDFEKWLQEKHKQLIEAAEESESKRVPIESVKKKFDKLFTDLSASIKRLDNIDQMASELQNHSKNVKPRQKQVHRLYSELNKLKAEKEKSLEGASIVELFYRNVSELEDWILEKQEQIVDDALVFHDLKTVQALQRRHKNIERELEPIREKLEKVQMMAVSAGNEYPREKPNINQALTKVSNLYQSMVNKAHERRERLENAVGKEIFQNSYKNLKTFSDNIESQINSKVVLIKDVSTAEDELKKHELLLDEIKNKSSEFAQVTELGENLGKKFPEITNNVEELNEMKGNLASKWQEKHDLLQQILDLQLFEKEADGIERQGREEDENDLGSNLEEVELLLKQHNDYLNSLQAMDERLKNFVQMAEKLELVHYEKEKIKERKEQVVNKRIKLKENAQKRRNDLQKSLRFHQFSTDINEMSDWVKEKKLVVHQDDYKDLTNLSKKLKKHQVFATELRANESKLKSINKSGQKLIQEDNEAVKVEEMLKELNSKWTNLSDLCNVKYVKLKQAEQQQNFNKNVDNLVMKLEEIETDLNSKDLGKDRRACKELLKKHEITEMELANCVKKIDDLGKLGKDLKDEGHFDGEKIVRASDNLRKNLEKLKGPAEKRRKALEELLRFYDFLFDLENEQSYIQEKKAVLIAMNLPTSLHEASLKTKKIEKFTTEVNNHKIVIDKVLVQGQVMIGEGHPEGKKIEQVSDELNQSWEQLVNLSSEKKSRFDLALKTHQYYNDALEVETWMAEKTDLLKSKEYGRDKEASVTLLTKHKATELEIDTYNGLIKEMGRLISKSNPDYQQMLAKQRIIEEQMEILKQLASERRSKLMETMNKHEFYIESGEFLVWIEEMIGVCSSEEYGVDYEHLERLRVKFAEVKGRVTRGEGRFKALEALVNRIPEESRGVVEEEVERVGTVDEVHGLVCHRFSLLLTSISSREIKLLAAGEIHRFNRDVADALERINEKLSEIPEDVGKDYNSCETLMRQMETFENDLVVVEAQLQVLIDDSTRLSTLYPTNAPNIQEEQQLVISNWTALQSKTETKKLQLQSTLDYYKFLSCYRDLTNWASNLLKQLDKFEQKGDAQLLMTDHERLKIEIENRNDKYEEIYELAASLEPEIQEKVQKLKSQQEALKVKWAKKKIFLDQLIDLQIFLRDSKALESILNSQEAILMQEDKSSTVEEVEKALKKHGDLENLIQKQNNKFQMAEGKKLIDQGHFEKEKVKEIVDNIVNKREKVLNLANDKRISLEKKLLYLKFVRDVEESLVYLDEKEKQLENLNKDTQTLEQKIKKLKKHQAFEAELRRGNVTTVITQASSIDPSLHQKLSTKYSNLLRLSKECGKGLEEAQDILDFQNEVEKLEQWMREREALVQNNDLGKDFEHCEELIKRLELDKVDDSRVGKINELGSRLQHDNPNISQLLSRLNTRWSDLKSGLDTYKSKLESSLEVHRFNKEVDELDLRIKEKIPSVNIEDVGRDLDGVEALIRKQDQVENQMRVIESRLKELEMMEKELKKKSPVSMEKVTQSWTKLSELCFKRRNDLTDAHSYQKFLKKLREFESFVEASVNKMRTAGLPNNITQAEELIAEQKAVKDELRAKMLMFGSIEKEMARSVIEDHQYSDELKKCIELVKELKKKLESAIETRDKVLDQGVKLQHFYKLATETENLLNELDSACKYYLGDELSLILKMLKVHQETGGSLLKKVEVKVEETVKFAGELVEKEHYESGKIESKSKQIKQKYDELCKTYSTKSKSLLDSRDFQKFLQNLQKIELYLKEKLQVASDDNYSDMTNLQSKIQKHQAFESEIGAFVDTRVHQVDQEGRALISNENCHSTDIKSHLRDLSSLVEELKTDSTSKRDRLYEAYQALLFYNNLEDLEIFLNEPNFEETGDNLTQCKYLLKKWLRMRENYNGKVEVRDNIKKQSDAFAKSNHFMKEEICEKVKVLLDKFDKLKVKLDDKLEEIQIGLRKFEYLRDVFEMREFVAEKSQSVSSLDLGNSVEQVKKIIKKLNNIKAEVESEKLTIETLGDPDLNEEFANLEEQINSKSNLLVQSSKSQQFYAQANEARFYIKEKTTIFNSTDYGTDEESVTKLIKKFESNYQNLNSFKTNFNQLIQQAEELQSNFDAEKVNETLIEVKSSFTSLQMLADTRKQKLSDSEKLFKFLHESTELIEWIEVQMNVAGSEDYGRDVEHVEILIQKFDMFLQSVLNTGENRVEHLVEGWKQLKELKHPEEGRIEERTMEVKGTWEEFKELASARTEALEGAKRVHMFDRGSDEIIGWITEKLVRLNEDSEMKFITQQDLIVEEKAVSEQVEMVKKDANELAQLFPDAEDHITCKLEETTEAYSIYQTKSTERIERLAALETIREYFDNYDQLISFLADVSGRADTLGIVVEGVERAEWNLQKFGEIESDYNGRKADFEKFFSTGDKLIESKHFLSTDIFSKIQNLREKIAQLEEDLKQKRLLLLQNLDLQKFYRDLNNFESLLTTKQEQLTEDKEIESISQVEEELRRFEDVELFVELIGGKLSIVERVTMIEELFEEGRKRERVLKEEELKRREIKEEVKRQEIERIKGERGGFGFGLFGDILKRGHHESTSSTNLPRSSSFRTQPTSNPEKKPKRTPSFTTRRRTQSFRKVKEISDSEKLSSLPPISIDGYLERKQEFISAQKRSSNRSWKTYYTVMCGQLLCFFKDQEDFIESKPAASAPVNICNCFVDVAKDYVKKKYVFRVRGADGFEYLFACESEGVMGEWVEKVRVVGGLEPREQLKLGTGSLERDNNEGQEELTTSRPSSSHNRPHRRAAAPDGNDGDLSSSDEDLIPNAAVLNKPRSREPLYANLSSSSSTKNKKSSSLEDPRRIGSSAGKPPIPPRSSSILSKEDDVIDNGNNDGAIHSYRLQHQHVTMRSFLHPPSVPKPAPRQMSNNFQQQIEMEKHYRYQHNTVNSYHNASSTSTLPPGHHLHHHPELMARSSGSLPSTTSTSSSQQVHHDSSSESDSPKSGKNKRSSGLMGLFRKKKATQL